MLERTRACSESGGRFEGFEAIFHKKVAKPVILPEFEISLCIRSWSRPDSCPNTTISCASRYAEIRFHLTWITNLNDDPTIFAKRLRCEFHMDPWHASWGSSTIRYVYTIHSASLSSSSSPSSSSSSEEDDEESDKSAIAAARAFQSWAAWKNLNEAGFASLSSSANIIS
jgi:hypothetical protein